MSRRLRVLFAALTLAAVPVFAAGDDKPGAAAALRAAEEPLRDRAWEKAAAALRAVREQFPAAPEAVEAWVLEARALHLAGKSKEAVDAGTEFLKRYGDAIWAGRMKGTMADAYAALHAGSDEAAVLRERGEFLTSPDARARIAALYVKLADADFDGVPGKDDLGRPKTETNFGRAREAYATALDIGVAAADRLRVRARLAESHEKVSDFAGAVGVWDALVTEKGADAGPGADPESWLVGRGRARLRAGDAPAARKDLKDALAKWPSGARHLEILRLLAQERFLAANGPEGDLAFDEGVAFLSRAIGEHRDAKEAPDVGRSLAEAYGARGRHQKAAGEWRALVERFPNHADAPVWRTALAESLHVAGQFDVAVAEWKAFLSAYPNDPQWQAVQARIVTARFEKGTALKDQGDVDGAIGAWKAFAEEYATDPRSALALTEAGALLAGRKDFEGAIAMWRGVVGRYANDAQAPRAWLLVAKTLEDDLGRLDDAVKEYEALIAKHGGTPFAPEAIGRLARLRGKHLEVRGERVIGSGEPAVLHVISRNMPTLKVKVFKLSIEEYFRRKHTVAGVENVQVEIVKPDLTAEWKLEPYAPFALATADRAVPTAGPGAYVVVISDDDLTSTTLLLVSDVEAVVKSAAGRQVFVWARNRASGKPEAGARVLVSTGSEMMAEGVTGPDGVFVVESSKPARRVLVLSGASAAASEWEPGQSYAEGWQTKVHVCTDRPVYRPGQRVKWRGIFRRANGGGYTIPSGVEASAVLLDARGAEAARTKVTCSETGLFDGEFALDGEAALGDWNVRIDVDNQSFSGPFRVLEFRKPEFSLEVVPGKPSYPTGEEVKATVRLRYGFGGPVVGAPVRWQVTRVPHDFAPSSVNDYSWYFQDADALQRARDAARTAPQGVVVAQGQASTDEKGEASLAFQTTERDEDSEYVVSASAIDVTRRFVSDEGRIPVVRRDHAAVVTTDKRVYRPKQELRATIQTVDANQGPVARTGSLVLARVKRVPAPGPLDDAKGREKRANAGGGFVPPAPPMPPGKVPPALLEEEIEVQTLPVSTDAKGRAEVRVVLPGPGAYRVRWNAKDARGGIVTAFAAFDVAGEAEDLTKDARLVAAKETYTEGERAEVLLQSPVSNATALLTFEGEKVLAHRLVEITGSSTLLDLPIEALYAPNVTLKIAIPSRGKDGERLLEAEDEIVVLRYLNVAVTPSKAVATPGEAVTFDVTTTDAGGKPVAAEVGVAVVDEALFGVARDRTPAIRPFFYDRKRIDRVVTASSVGFRTYGTTRETNKELLANAAAQSGDAQTIFAQSALRLAREALNRGDVQTAVAQAFAASQAAPDSWDARALVAELKTRPDAQEALKLLDRSLEAEKAVDELRQVEGDRAKADSFGGMPPPPAAAPAPMPPGAGAPRHANRKAGDWAMKDAEAADHNESDNDAPAEDSAGEGGLADKKSPAEERLDAGTITMQQGGGGGVGGAFKGRGGRRNLRARGGGAAAAQGYFNDGGDGDFRGRTENVFDRASILAVENADLRQQVQQLEARFQQSQSAADQAMLMMARQQAALAQAQAQSAYGLDAAVATALRKNFADTAAWEPKVRTDAQGKASIRLTLPDNLTTWRATARGVAGESLVGEGKATLVSKKDVLLRVDAPRFLVQGDHVVVPSAVHNQSGAELSGTVKMKADGVELGGEDAPITVAAGSRSIRDRALDARSPGAVRIEAEVTSPQGGDRVETGFATLPRGLKVIDGRSGLVTTERADATQTFLDVPEKAIPGATRLVVALEPGVDAAILDALLYLDLFPYGCVEQTVHRFVPATWARRALSDIGSPDAKRLDQLAEAIRQGYGRLVNLRNDDGTFGWFRGGAGDPAMTAFALMGLSEAAALDVPGSRDAALRTAAALRTILKSAPDDVQALCHWALATVGQVEEEAYQITFRRRNEELSVPGLAWLALAANRMGRAYDAEDLARILVARRVEDGDATRWAGRKDDCLAPSERLATALAVRALVLTGASTEQAERGMNWLLAHRVDGGFGNTIETAAFVGAASAWVSKARPARFGGTIHVLADGTDVRAVNVVATQGIAPADRRFSIEAAAGWKPGRHTLAFRLEGEGRVRWAARLETVEAADELLADEHGLRVERLYLDAQTPVIEGAEMPAKPGYEILRPSARPKVEAKSKDKAGTGERLLVRVTVTTPRDLQYVVVEDPLPAGFEVLDETAAGPFDRQERRDDRQVFFLSRVKAGTVVLTYAMQAVHLGAFTALPTRAYALYLPEVNGRGAGQRVSVTEPGSKGADGESAPTPDELYARAMKRFAEKAWKDAAAALTALRTDRPLRDEVVVEIEAALLRCAIQTKDAKEIVRAREELVRRDGSRIPNDLEAVRAIAAAYADSGAFAVAAGLYRDLVARAFDLEVRWSQTLTQRGREVEALGALGTTIASYPISNATAAAELTRASRYRELRRPADTATGKKGGPMDEEGLAALRSFVAHFAETPLAAPGSYAIIDALRRVRDLDGAVTEATAFPRRFPESAFVDDALWFLTDTRLVKFDASPSAESAAPVLEAANRLVTEKFPRTDGSKDWSEFAPRGWHAIGRVNHVTGDLEKAIYAYERASGIADAAEALAFLREARLETPEAVTAPIAGAASFPVTYRNVSSVAFKVYPVDLQVLFSVRRTLVGLNKIDLAGIAPAKEWTLPLKDGADHGRHETSVELPVGHDVAGVYLVVVKAGDIETSTIVVKTDLTVTLQAVGEKVRVHVTDAKGKGVRAAYVTVSDGSVIKARGLTDARGIFEAPGVGAHAFVVASLEDRIAIAK